MPSQFPKETCMNLERKTSSKSGEKTGVPYRNNETYYYSTTLRKIAVVYIDISNLAQIIIISVFGVRNISFRKLMIDINS
jgi:hypothetical protein